MSLVVSLVFEVFFLGVRFYEDFLEPFSGWVLWGARVLHVFPNVSSGSFLFVCFDVAFIGGW